MKLPNFIKNNVFKEIRRNLNINEGYVASCDFNINFNQLNLKLAEFEVLEHGKGLEISLHNLDAGIDNTISYDDHNVIVYIRDQYAYKSKYKYHVSWCKTLRDMRDNNKLNRYIISRRTDGLFNVNILDAVNHQLLKQDVLEELQICKYCLGEINYKGYKYKKAYEKNKIYESFSLEEFLKEYDTKFNQLPKNTDATAPINEYTEDWDQISRRFRSLKKWTCEECGKDCRLDKSELDTHHIDSNKYNNDYSNLKALCKDCHGSQYNHKHYKDKIKNK